MLREKEVSSSLGRVQVAYGKLIIMHEVQGCNEFHWVVVFTNYYLNYRINRLGLTSDSVQETLVGMLNLGNCPRIESLQRKLQVAYNGRMIFTVP